MAITIDEETRKLVIVERGTWPSYVGNDRFTRVKKQSSLYKINEAKEDNSVIHWEYICNYCYVSIGLGYLKENL